MNHLIFILIFGAVAITTQAQSVDSIDDSKLIEEIVVTATKTETKLEKSTVPLSVIAKKYIKASGTVKLSDLLQEQTGLQQPK